MAVWFELSTEQRADYVVAKEQLITKMAPMEFVSLEEFHSHKMRSGEAIALYLHYLKRLLQQAIPELEANARKSPFFVRVTCLSKLATPCDRRY